MIYLYALIVCPPFIRPVCIEQSRWPTWEQCWHAGMEWHARVKKYELMNSLRAEANIYTCR